MFGRKVQNHTHESDIILQVCGPSYGTCDYSTSTSCVTVRALVVPEALIFELDARTLTTKTAGRLYEYIRMITGHDSLTKLEKSWVSGKSGCSYRGFSFVFALERHFAVIEILRCIRYEVSSCCTAKT